MALGGEPAEEPVKRTTARLPRSLHYRLRMAAMEAGLTIDDWIREAATLKLDGGSADTGAVVLRNRKNEISIKSTEVEWVEKLLGVLRSGHHKIISAIHHNLIAFSYVAQENHEPAKPPTEEDNSRPVGDSPRGRRNGPRAKRRSDVNT